MPNGCSTTRASTSPFRRAAARRALDHLGIQVENKDELSEIYARLQHAGGEVVEQGETACCYAKSEKSWIEDPAGLAWEAFLTTGENTDYGDGSGERLVRIAHEKSCCAPPVSAKADACCDSQAES
jgi:hypothetical protein